MEYETLFPGIRLIRVENLQLPELGIYTGRRESQLMHYFEPEPGIFIAETMNVILRALDGGYVPLSMLVEEEALSGEKPELLELIRRCGATEERTPEETGLSRESAFPVYTAPSRELMKITGYPLTRGVLCAMRRRALPSVRTICRDAARVVILEEVMNPVNVGAIFRSAAALNMDAVLLTAGCSDPLYRRAIRVSMGTVFQLPWTFLPGTGADWLQEGLPLLRELGFRTAAMALRRNTVDVDDKKLLQEERLAVMLGTEGEGLREETIDAADYTIKIPMSHGVDSLNVAAASAIAFWQLGNKGDRLSK